MKHFMILPVLLFSAAGVSFAFSNQPHQSSVVIVGKIIVDEYGNPEGATAPTITVGGGGPQAAIGAALGLATRSFLREGTKPSDRPPPPQPIYLLGAVGDLDFSADDEIALIENLQPALQEAPRLLRGKDFFTPRIRLWHDQDQVLQWYALNDSFGKAGAAGLWASLPSVEDYLDIIEQQPTKPILQIISEAGADAPGANGDSRPLLDPRLRKAISFLGVEPILFPNEEGIVSVRDAQNCAKLLQEILNVETGANPATVVVSPDMAAFTAMKDFLPQSKLLDSWAVRNGPKGSLIVQDSQSTHVPAATLKELVNPTGAGNAYSAAYTTLRGSGCDPIESVCIATGVGAVFCEYSHCPPYTWDVIERVATASKEVKAKVMEKAVA